MKTAILLIIALCLMAAPAVAFHDAGVAHCNGCHTMHNSQGGVAIDTDLGVGQGNPHLLKDATPSDVCLNCHATSYGGVFMDPTDTNFKEQGGGNFWYLNETNLNDGHGGAIPGDEAGHNLHAPGHGLTPDLTQAGNVSPGGSFPTPNFACTSCHDPHGTEDFRFLYGAGRNVQGETFTNAAPDAEGIGLFGPGESNTNHTAYKGANGATMSAWCGNCHGDFHAGWASNLIHPSGQLISNPGIVNNYNKYLGTSDLIANGNLEGTGATATAYLAQVPFEDVNNTTSSTLGVNSGSSQVSCITCHRAHASSGPDAGRWDFNITIQAEDGSNGEGNISPDPYGDPEQRSLCNKCHIKDAFDHHSNPVIATP